MSQKIPYKIMPVWYLCFMVKNRFPIYNIDQLADFRQEDILISRFAPYLKVHKNLQIAHKHTFYHLVFFLTGSGSQTIDFQNFGVRSHQIYFMIPGQVHHWDFEDSVDGYVVNFSEKFFQSFLLKPSYLEQFAFFSGNATEAVIDIPQEFVTNVTTVFEKLVTEYNDKQGNVLDMIKLLLLELFIIVDRVSPALNLKQGGSYNLVLLKNFRNLIELDYLTKRLPKEYADLLYITPNHLNALCNDLLGVPAGEVIRSRVVLEAKRLLINPMLSVSEVSNQLNFSDNSYFTKFFKKQEGKTPEEFRKEFAQSN